MITDGELLAALIVRCAQLQAMPQVASATFDRSDASKPPTIRVLLRGEIDATDVRGTLVLV